MKNTDNHRTAKTMIFAVIAAWFLFSLTMGISGWFANGGNEPPIRLGLTIVLPISFFVAAYLRRRSLWAFTQTLDLKVLVLLNIWRLMGCVFLADYAKGLLPAGFALPAGIGDIAVGLAAIPLALAISRNTPGVQKLFTAWNIFGIADLIVAVSSGILHSPGPFGALAGNGPTTLLMSQFPLCMIPTFLVPMFILMHLLALSRSKELGINPPAATA